MKKSLIFQLFSEIEKSHWRNLKKWLRSPFYNHRKDVVDLFDYLCLIKKTNRAVPNKNKVFEKLYGKVPYDDGKLRLVMSFLLRRLEAYLLQDYFKNSIPTNIALAQVYRKLNLSKQFESQIKTAQKTLERATIRNALFYDHKFEIEWQSYAYSMLDRKQEETFLQSLGENLDIAYFAKKLQQACYALAHQVVYQTTYELALLPEILQHIENQNLQNVSVISIYYHCYQALQCPAEEGWFERFIEILKRHQSEFPEEELRSLYLLALNFCIRQYNAGNREYLSAEFKLYRESLEAGFLYKDGFLSRFTYRNLLTVCLAADELEWAFVFNQKYQEKLEPQYRESAFSFNQARLEYRQKNYKNALLLLQKSEFEEFFTNFAAKIIMFKIFYETEEWIIISSHLDSMKTFLYRKKNMGYHRTNYLNFLHYARKLLKIRLDAKKSKQLLFHEIESVKQLAERTWFLKQLKL